MNVVIVVNGPQAAIGPWREQIDQAGLVIAADGGARQAHRLGLHPHLVVGDADSLDEETLLWLQQNRVRIQRHPRDKDESDLELALLYAVEAGAEEIIILGALGGRPDQTVANLHLLAHPTLDGRRVRLLGPDYELFLLHGDAEATIAGAVGDTVSLLPLSDEARGIHTAGLRWSLHGNTLYLGQTRGLSNEMTAHEAQIRLQQGRLLVVHLLDAAGRKKREGAA